MTQLNHPLAVGTKVRVAVPGCPCRQASLDIVEGTVLKVITNQTGFWYYLDLGRTVKDNQIQCTL